MPKCWVFAHFLILSRQKRPLLHHYDSLKSQQMSGVTFDSFKLRSLKQYLLILLLKNDQQSVKLSVILKNRYSPPYKTTERVEGKKKKSSRDQRSPEKPSPLLIFFKVKNKLTPDIKYYKLWRSATSPLLYGVLYIPSEALLLVWSADTWSRWTFSSPLIGDRQAASSHSTVDQRRCHFLTCRLAP